MFLQTLGASMVGKDHSKRWSIFWNKRQLVFLGRIVFFCFLLAGRLLKLCFLYCGPMLGRYLFSLAIELELFGGGAMFLDLSPSYQPQRLELPCV